MHCAATASLIAASIAISEKTQVTVKRILEWASMGRMSSFALLACQQFSENQKDREQKRNHKRHKRHKKLTAEAQRTPRLSKNLHVPGASAVNFALVCRIHGKLRIGVLNFDVIV